MARPLQPQLRHGAPAPCTPIPPGATFHGGLFALALWLLVAVATGLASSASALFPSQAGFASAGSLQAPQASLPQDQPHAGLERDGAGHPFLFTEAEAPLPPARLDAGEDRFKRHGQKDRDAFHGTACSSSRSGASEPAGRPASLAFSGRICRQAWRCFALLALPPPLLHA